MIGVTKIFAQTNSDVKNLFGTVTNPLATTYGDYNTGLIALLTNIIRLAFVAAGVFALFNFIVAGFQYMNAGGDAKALAAAWSRIWLSLVGLIILVGSFALAALFGLLFFGNAGFILNPVIYGPK